MVPVAHGDWRVHLDSPQDVLRKSVPKLSLKKRLMLRVNFLQNAPISSELHGLLGSATLPSSSQPYGLNEEDAKENLSHGWPRLLRVLLASLIMLPLSVVCSYALLLELAHRGQQLDMGFFLSTPVFFCLMGMGLFCCLAYVKIFNTCLIYSYVLGHELSHAIAIIISLGKIHDFKIDVDGGYVETDANNFFIALAPYFLPLWMLVWLTGFVVVNWITPFAGYEEWLFGGLGFWWLFHIYWTIWIIPREQPDMLENGLLFSSLLIWLMNLGIVVVMLRVFGLVSFTGLVDHALGIVEYLAAIFV